MILVYTPAKAAPAPFKTIAGTAGFVWFLASAYGAVQFLEIMGE